VAPRIAVVIPCFNDGELLVQAVDSVRESEAVELVVVDDGSTEARTQQILAELAAQAVPVVRHERNRGLSEARNSGMRATRARYVFPLDSDDAAVPGALAAMADRLDGRPGAAFAFGDYEEFGTHELVRAVPFQLDAYRIAYRNEYPVSALFRREVLEQVGGWRRPNGYEDWDLWMTLAERGLFGAHMGVAFVTFRKRFHGPRMLTAVKREHRTGYREMREHHPRLFAELRRHRASSDLSPARKVLYPIFYGGRRRFGFEPAVNRLLDRLGIWTLRR
jgi:glycosyltransferase involved in cell wall biosynthesis